MIERRERTVDAQIDARERVRVGSVYVYEREARLQSSPHIFKLTRGVFSPYI